MPPRNVSTHQQTRILLVEGPNDKHVVRHIIRRQFSGDDDGPNELDIRDMEGVEQLLEIVGAEIIAPNRQSVGILVDADDDVDARWAAVRRRLLEEGIEAPTRPCPNGTIIHTEGKPLIGIWIMPDNEAKGELEGFVEQMIPASDQVWPSSQRYVDEIPEEHRKFKEKKSLRAKIHSWLAVRKDPRQMGLAIRARDLDIDGDLCQKFTAGLRNSLVNSSTLDRLFPSLV